jgi:hypothetical protein
MVLAEVDERARFVDVVDRMHQRALPPREERQDENNAEQRGGHARQYKR